MDPYSLMISHKTAKKDKKAGDSSENNATSWNEFVEVIESVQT